MADQNPQKPPVQNTPPAAATDTKKKNMRKVKLAETLLHRGKFIGPGEVELTTEDADLVEEHLERSKKSAVMGGDKDHQRPDGSLTIMNESTRIEDGQFARMADQDDVLDQAEEAEQRNAEETQRVLETAPESPNNRKRRSKKSSKTEPAKK